MKIISYNIMSGGFKDYGDKSQIPERLEIIKQAIKKENADFVSLIDTYRWSEVFSLEDIKNIFGYKNVFTVKLNDDRLIKKGHDNGITVMTNMEVNRFTEIRLFNRNAIKTEVVIDKKIIDVFSIYLDDLSEDTRLKQLKSLFSMIKSTNPTLFMGDINSMDKEDKTVIPWVNLDLNKVLEDMNKGEVITFIKENGFIDTNTLRLKTAPSKLFPIKLAKPVMRIDYIFHNKYFRTEEFNVLYDNEFNRASDHFPIEASVDLL
jgi:endonuclease/exonuclease/phosphatase family metal-dependent hydrolase